MNTRGLMELVILNIGRELGVITDAVFAMMVIMALVTTFLTTPMLHWVYPPRLFTPVPRGRPAGASGAFSVLIPVSDPRSGGAAAAAGATCSPGRATRGGRSRRAPGRPVERDAYRSGIGPRRRRGRR